MSLREEVFLCGPEVGLPSRSARASAPERNVSGMDQGRCRHTYQPDEPGPMREIKVHAVETHPPRSRISYSRMIRDLAVVVEGSYSTVITVSRRDAPWPSTLQP